MVQKQIPRRLRIPIPFYRGPAVGLGDVVKRVTTSVGVRPCGGCGRRAQAMNRRVVFGGSGGGSGNK